MFNTIKKELEGFNLRTGHKPTAIYIGDNEDIRLEQWAYDQGYIASIPTKWTGAHRPEILGIPVYIVNDISYLDFS